MKKFISLLLSVIMVFTIALPVFAVEATTKGSQVPVILIGGDGDAIYDKDGNQIFKITELGNTFKDTEGGNVWEAVANVMLPFVMEGIMSNKWDKYYENLQKEITELTAEIIPDENGDIVNGSNISKAHQQEVEYNRHLDKKGSKGYYGYNDYVFWYDWRLDPVILADDLALYIDDILAATNQPKVSVIARCIGANVLLAYIAKYGTEKLHGVGIGATTSNGAEMISEAISGKFCVDGNAIYRYMTDLSDTGYMSIDAFYIAMINLLEKNGTLDCVTEGFKKTIYSKIVEGATSAICLSTFCSMPCYWAMVTTDDYDDAIKYCFGAEGSEKRVKYAGLIEKIEGYNNLVKNNIPELMTQIHDNCNLAITSKYGRQMLPICKSNDVVSDQYASVTRSSFGATTSDIYSTLSDEYIAERTAQGLEKYISPDKQVDASTCMFPDNTWFIKGANHNDWTMPENSIIYTVITSDEKLTVNDLQWTQFLVYSYETKELSIMTEDNCHSESWSTDKEDYEPSSVITRLKNLVKAFVEFLRLLWAKIVTKAEA